jgi:tRNA pseudouridine38-40 synthase
LWTGKVKADVKKVVCGAIEQLNNHDGEMTAVPAGLLAYIFVSLSILPSCGWSGTIVERQGRNNGAWRRCGALHDNDDGDSRRAPPLVSGLLKVSYDGAHFSGWSAANQQNEIDEATVRRLPSSGRKRRKRSHDSFLVAGQTRSVERVLQVNLAKLYGNVDPSRIVVEGCSRTDKCVHAKCLVAQFYCLAERYDDEDLSLSSSIPGKRKPHPRSSFDSSPCFTALPMSIGKVMYCLNRMLPHDVKVRAVAKVPERNRATSVMDDERPFHPTLDAVSKTYEYTFSVGPVHDPLMWRTVWHLEADDFSYEDAERASRELFVGRHKFAAFRGAPRGKDDKRRHDEESTVCRIFNSTMSISSNESTLPGVPLTTYTVSITGDRFLYKMVRFVVGSLVAVGTGRLSYDIVRRALETGAWEDSNGDTVQFTCAPAHGLVLTKVGYDLPIEWITCTNRQSTLGR